MVYSPPIACAAAAIFCLIVAACSPLPRASAPPQLRHTPGAYIEIANGHFNAGAFQFDFPATWLVVKQSAANADGLHIILRAPSGAELSLRAVDSETGEDAVLIPLAKGGFVAATINAPDDLSTRLAAELEQIIRSIRG